MKKPTPAYVTVKRWDLYGLKAVPTHKLDNDRAEFIIIEPNPHHVSLVWLTRSEIC